MGIVRHLSALALRPVALGGRNAADGTDPGDVVKLLEDRFIRLDARGTAALQAANEQAWLVWEIALAGEVGWNRWQAALQGSADQPLRQALRQLLDCLAPGQYADLSGPSRQECADRLRSMRHAGALVNATSPAGLARLCIPWVESSNAELHQTEAQLIGLLVAELRQANQAHLALLLELQPVAAEFLAVSARTLFAQVVRQDAHLMEAFPWMVEEPLPEEQRRGFWAIAETLPAHRSRLEQLFEIQVNTATPPLNAGSGANHSLNLAADLHRHDPAVQQVCRDVMHFLTEYRLDNRDILPGDCYAVCDEFDRQRVIHLLNQAVGYQQSIPALLHGVGKLNALAGSIDSAQQVFLALASIVQDPTDQAEAFYHVYQMALERRQWNDALSSLLQAAALDPVRYSLFPLTKYEPQAIVRSDGASVTFYCRHRTSDSPVTVETLHAAYLDRPVSEVFHEAQVLDSLERPAILRLRDCDFADHAKARPYLVCDYFDGLTLYEYVDQNGPLSAEDLLAVVRPVVEALEAAHSRDIIHRNLQPGSFLIRKDPSGWRVKLINFGLEVRRELLRFCLGNSAALAHTLLGASTLRRLEYAAPEQLGRLPGTSPSPQSDIFSFGRTCYFALLHTPEPDDEEKEGINPVWRKLLGQCTSITTSRRLANFSILQEQLKRPMAAPAAPKPAAAAASPAQADPHEAAACIQRGTNYRLKGQLDRAASEFDQAIRLDPTSSIAYQGRGNVYSNQGEFDRAIADYTTALRLDPKLSLALVNRGLAFIKKRDTNRAIADYSAAIKQDPKLSLAYMNRGSAYARLGDYGRAIADYTQAIGLDPKHPVAYFNRGLAHAKKGELDNAIADYNKALTLSPNNPEIQSRLQEAKQQRSKNGPAAPKAKPAPAPAPAPAEETVEAAKVLVLEGHTSPVRCAAFSPDGRKILSGSEDMSIRLWDARTGKKQGRFTGHTGGVLALAFTPDGTHVVTGGHDHTVRLWNIETGEEVRRFGAGRFFGSSGHSQPVVSVAVSPNGQQAISASWDKTVRLWDIESGREIRCFEGHNWLIHCVAYAVDGRNFLYGSEDQTLRLCNVESGKEIRRFTGHTSWVLSVAFSPDGRFVLSGSSDGTMRLWSVSRGKELRRFGGQMGLIQCVAFSPDGRHALSGEYTLPNEDTLVRWWSLDNGQELARFTGHQQLIWSVAVSPDGKSALSGSADQTVRVWHLQK